MEHLLNSVFILENKAKALDTVVESFDEFLKILSDSAKNFSGENPVSISGILGPKRRLVCQQIEAFEAKLKQELEIGNVGFLIPSQSTLIGGKTVQLYEVNRSKATAVDETPF